MLFIVSFIDGLRDKLVKNEEFIYIFAEGT